MQAPSSLSLALALPETFDCVCASTTDIVSKMLAAKLTKKQSVDARYAGRSCAENKNLESSQQSPQRRTLRWSQLR